MHSQKLDDQDLWSNRDRRDSSAICSVAIALWRVASELVQSFGHEISAEMIFDAVDTTVRESMHRQFDAGASVSSDSDPSTVVTRPFLPQLRLEQSVHGYISDGWACTAIDIPAKQSQLSVETVPPDETMMADSTSSVIVGECKHT